MRCHLSGRFESAAEFFKGRLPEGRTYVSAFFYVWRRRFKHGFGGQYETQRMRHARMPRSGTGHLWTVIRNNHAIKVLRLQVGQAADHVPLSFVVAGPPVWGA